MISFVMLFAAAALTPLQCAAYSVNRKVEIDNNLIHTGTPIKRHGNINYVGIVTPPPESVRHIPGTTLILTCHLKGNPSPVVNWLKNGVPVTNFEDDENEILSIPSFSPTDMISKLVLRAPSNGDIYTCFATSGIYEISASTTVIVNGDTQPQPLASIIQSKPVITTFYNNILKNQGSTVIFPCRVDSPTESQVVWFHNGDIVYENDRLRVLPSGDLHITNLVWSDMGTYTCTAKNAFGKDSIDTFLYPVKV